MILKLVRGLLRYELRRLERRIFSASFDSELSAQIDRVRAALEALQ